MDLNSLLNHQKESSLTLSDLYQLLQDPDVTKRAERIRTTTTFDYPHARHETFEYFDVFIRVLLSLGPVDVIDSFRRCVNGLLQRHGVVWLVHFPRHFSIETWTQLVHHPTLLIYLYGLVLALVQNDIVLKEGDAWICGVLEFLRINSVAIVVHLWLTCCELDRHSFFLDRLEEALQGGFVTAATVREVWVVLKNRRDGWLASQVDHLLGTALTRPPFSRDELTLAYLDLKQWSNHYVHIHRALRSQQLIENSGDGDKNPLLNDSLLSTLPTDPLEQTEAVRQGTLFWVQQFGQLSPDQFDHHLCRLIQHTYPSHTRRVLDLVLADWTVRDRFERHGQLVIDALYGTTYDARTTPYDAFIQLFQGKQQQESDSHNSINHFAAYKQTRSGALLSNHLDTGEFIENNDSRVLFLQRLARRRHDSWLHDCLEHARPSLIRAYTVWLAQHLNLVSLTATTKADVPTLLTLLSDTSLEQLLHSSTSTKNTLLVDYFDQPSRSGLVRALLQTKSTRYMDLLMTYLRTHFTSTTTSQHNNAWFEQNFLAPIVEGVAMGAEVATAIFSQIISIGFDSYLGQSTTTTTFDMLQVARQHEIVTVRQTGLARLFQTLVKIKNDTSVVDVWRKTWHPTTTTQPPSLRMVLQCVGLVDQAPAMVKRMVADVCDMTTVERLMDVVLLSDTMEPDTVFDFVLEVVADTTTDEVRWAIVNTMIEVGQELALNKPKEEQRTMVPSTIEANLNVTRMGRSKLVAKMRLHEQQLLARQDDDSPAPQKPLSILIQRLFHFLLRLFHNEEVATHEAMQLELVAMPLYFVALGQIWRVVKEPLIEDVQALIELSLRACMTAKGHLPIEMAQKLLFKTE
ncbi:MAG: hypothetical protein EXX96DRAFT_581116 [Benjaminiella poitrasii]|nr:MAG: hypothetical protein EXX96DRAFT_581116 [Benjaminiella poitrasii]